MADAINAAQDDDDGGLPYLRMARFGCLSVPTRRFPLVDVIVAAEKARLDVDRVEMFVRPGDWLNANFCGAGQVTLTDQLRVGSLRAPFGFSLLASEPFVLAIDMRLRAHFCAVLSRRGQLMTPHPHEAAVGCSPRRVEWRVFKETLAEVGAMVMWVARYGMKMPVDWTNGGLSSLMAGVDWDYSAVLLDIGVRYRVPSVCLFQHDGATTPGAGRIWGMFNLATLGSVTLTSALLPEHLLPAVIKVTGGVLYPEVCVCVCCFEVVSLA
jgi:hypothetical protein